MTYIIAHRGASRDAPENTLAAFGEAWRQQADGIEGDYGYTADQQIVCIHDDDLVRTGCESLVVAQSTYDQLKAVDVGSWKSPQFSDQRVPLLRQVLDQMPPDKWCVIELKTGPEIVTLLNRDLSASSIDRSRILLIAFDQRTVLEAKRQMSEIKAHWLVDYRQLDSGDWSPTAEEIAETVRSCQADGIGSQASRTVVTAQFIERLKSCGVDEFHFWTVDDPQDARFYQSVGAWGITTNRPAFIRHALGVESE